MMEKTANHSPLNNQLLVYKFPMIEEYFDYSYY